MCSIWVHECTQLKAISMTKLSVGWQANIDRRRQLSALILLLIACLLLKKYIVLM